MQSGQDLVINRHPLDIIRQSCDKSFCTNINNITMSSSNNSCLMKCLCCWNCWKLPLALFAGMGDIELTEYENKVLNQNLTNFVWQSGFSQSFLAWRRRLLYCASFLLGLSVILQIGDLVWVDDENSFNQTTLGWVAEACGRIYPFITFMTVFFAAWFWTDYGKTRNILVPGWVLGLALVTWPNLVPIEWLMEDTDELDSIRYGLNYSLAILPTYFSLIGGLTLGSKRVFTFSPSPLSGAMVVLSAAFSVIIPFAAMTLIVQLIGDALLLSGLCMILLSPILILATNNKFTEVNSFSSTDTMKGCQRLLLASMIVRIVGFLIILYWVLDYSKDGIVLVSKYVDGIWIEGLLSDVRIGEIIIELIAGTMFQAVIWTDIVVHVSRHDDLKMKKLSSDLASES